MTILRRRSPEALKAAGFDPFPDVPLPASVATTPIVDSLLSEVQSRQAAVLALSVYNALDLSRQDLDAPGVVMLLHASWVPAFGSVKEVVTVASVEAAAEQLEAAGFIERRGGKLCPTLRDPTGRARPLRLNRERTALVG